MSIGNHNTVKEALEDGANRVLVVDGVVLGTLSYTRNGPWMTNDDGSIAPPAFTTAFVPSPDCQAAIADWKAAQAPSSTNPPPSDPPADPPPADGTDAIGALAPGQTITPPEDA